MGELARPMKAYFSFIEKGLKSNIDDVYRLAEFDQELLGIAIRHLKKHEEALNKIGIDNPTLTAINPRKALEDIRHNNSLRPRFEVINNQCVVLLVSLFSSAIGDVFRKGVETLASMGTSETLNREEIKLTVSEIVNEHEDISYRVGRLVEENNNISFQDMRSIHRAFQKYFEIETPKDQIVNTIIFAQASRHIIVHDGGIVNQRFLNQIRDSTPADLKGKLIEGEKLFIDSKRLRDIGNSMLTYFSNLRPKVEDRLRAEGSQKLSGA